VNKKQLMYLPIKHEYSPSQETIKEVNKVCGLPLYWVITEEDDSIPFKDVLSSAYDSPMSEFIGGTITKEGIYNYPDSSNLEPLIKVYNPETKETFYQYNYGIIAIVQEDGSSYISLML